MTGAEAAAAEAAAAARDGELIVFPTDTVYGIGARPDDPRATGKVFAAKRRPRDLELPILASTTAEARAVGAFDERASRLAEAFWPGALTLVLPRTGEATAWELGGDPSTVGLRVPRHLLAREILSSTGPLAVTSANLSGEPPARTCEELHDRFGDLVAVYLCDDTPLDGAASTVLDLAHGRARILRTGAISPARLEELLPREAPLLDSPPS